MLIGIISDTHDHIENIAKAVQVFREKNARLVIHLGDYVNPGAVRALRGLHVVGILGNNDGDTFRLAKAFEEIAGELKGDFGELHQDGLSFALYHGTEPQIKNALVHCGRYNVVLCGHTHTVEHTKVKHTLVLNPGSAHGFGGSATVMLFDTHTKKFEVVGL